VSALKRCCKNLRSKGSITAEACIIFPAFLSVFFLLLFLVKFTCTGILLDYAVNETAKEIATSAYPISFINEFEDEKLEEYGNAAIPTLEEELEELADQFGGFSPDNVLSTLVSEDFKGAEATEAIKGILEDYRKGIIGGIVDSIKPIYWDMKSSGKYFIADTFVKEHLKSPLLNRERVKLRLVEFPQGKAEFEARSKSKIYESFGLTPGEDFNGDDVVIQLEYDYRVKLPFMKPLIIKMVHTAVERAWITGSFGILTVEDEGFDLKPEEDIVFITRTGIRYHRGSCRHLRKSKLPMDVGEAKADGYTPCKVCKPIS
jgi:hypothetical protein